jgi:hypothetical protein
MSTTTLREVVLLDLSTSLFIYPHVAIVGPRKNQLEIIMLLLREFSQRYMIMVSSQSATVYTTFRNNDVHDYLAYLHGPASSY